jgi:hypothetical protein
MKKLQWLSSSMQFVDKPLCRFAGVLSGCRLRRKTQALTESGDSSRHIGYELQTSRDKQMTSVRASILTGAESNLSNALNASRSEPDSNFDFVRG